jgi:succinate dehydrogenase / fumarate reductase membrane anchor subunit
MVTSITSLGKNGIYDWLVQRVTAVVLLSWFLYIGFVIAGADSLDYPTWKALFAQSWMRIFTLLALLSLCAHAWIGMWTISTDYFTTRMLGSAATLIRFVFQFACLIVLIVYFVWCVQILWSI